MLNIISDDVNTSINQDYHNGSGFTNPVLNALSIAFANTLVNGTYVNKEWSGFRIETAIRLVVGRNESVDGKQKLVAYDKTKHDFETCKQEVIDWIVSQCLLVNPSLEENELKNYVANRVYGINHKTQFAVTSDMEEFADFAKDKPKSAVLNQDAEETEGVQLVSDFYFYFDTGQDSIAPIKSYGSVVLLVPDVLKGKLNSIGTFANNDDFKLTATPHATRIRLDLPTNSGNSGFVGGPEPLLVIG